MFLTIVNKIGIKIGKNSAIKNCIGNTTFHKHLHNNFEKSSKILTKKLTKKNFFLPKIAIFSDFWHYAYNIIVKNECF